MSTYIVCWTLKKEKRDSKESKRIVPEKFIDHYEVFNDQSSRKNKEEAQQRYNHLLTQEEVYTASLNKVIESTDY